MSSRAYRKSLGSLCCGAVGLLMAASALPAPAYARGKKESGRSGSQAAVVRDSRREAGRGKTPAELLRSGTEALAQKNFAAASADLQQSYRQAPYSEALFQLGMLAEAEGRTVAAHDILRRYLFEAPSDDTTASADKARAILAKGMPAHGELSIVAETQGLVLVDGLVVGSLPLPMPLLVPPGNHQVVIEVGAKRIAEQVPVTVGRNAELRFKLNPQVVAVSLAPAVLYLPKFEGLTAQEQQQVETAALEGARAAKYSLLRVEDALLQSAAQQGCIDQPACQLALAQGNGLSHILTMRSQVSGAKRDQWRFDVQLQELTIKEPASDKKALCSGCSVERAKGELKAALTDSLQSGTVRARTTLEVKTTPPGAAVLLNKVALGVTPLSAPVWTGASSLTLSLPGFAQQEQQLELAAGTPATVEVTLLPALTAKVEPATQVRWIVQPRPRWRLALGGALLGLGPVVGGLGISALSVNGQCKSFETAPACEHIFETNGIGGSLVGLGVGMIGAGVVFLALPGKQTAAEMRVQDDSRSVALPTP